MKLNSVLLACAAGLVVAPLFAAREYIWPAGKMPHAQAHQIAAMTDEPASSNRVAYLEWMPPPAQPNGLCVMLISGGGYNACCDCDLIRHWNRRFTAIGCQCVNFVYRTPRPKGMPFYQTAWEDGQRAVRMVRAQAARRGFDPERIGTMSMSAGSHLATLLATSALTPAYAPVDEIDRVPCHIAFAITGAIAYGYAGDKSPNGLPDAFAFDAKTAPMCMFHGGVDWCDPRASTYVYRALRKKGIPAELHLFADRNHPFWGWREDAVGRTGYDDWFFSACVFLRHLKFIDRAQEAAAHSAAQPNRAAVKPCERIALWPEGKMPDVQTNQCTPYLEWHIPAKLSTKAIQILYAGGGYFKNNPDKTDGVPAARQYLNARGMTVVILKYRTPRPTGRAKHLSAWQDVQRAVRVVRSQANCRGLDPNRIGIWGSSAGGHLTLMGATSSTVPAYAPVDAIDALPCNVQWAVAVYPAYVLTDGADGCNKQGGNERENALVNDFAFDALTCPTIFLHGDADGFAAMGSVKCWEKMREMGVQGDLHTLATRKHCFMCDATEGTLAYSWLDRVWGFFNHKGFNR